MNIQNDHTALMLVHAFPVDARIWDPQVAALKAPGRTILVPNLPGFGGTPLPTAQPSMDSYADALVHELDTAGMGKAVVCGLSMGGYIAFALWRRHAARIAGFIFADTKAEPDNEPGKAGRVALAAKLREMGTEKAFFSAAPPPWLRAESPQWPALKEIILRQPAEAAAQAALAMGARPDSTADLAKITVPVAVIVGDGDAITTPANAQTIADGIKGSTLTVIKDAGHLSSFEQPAAFNSAVSAFLKKVGV